MTFVSLFAGVGGFDLGMEAAGHECVGQCEIDPHAVSILQRHWPHVPRHDDVTTLQADTFAHPDVVTFGSPCQDLSVAGKRAGLDGARSGLFMEAVRYIRDVREASNGSAPTYAIWENVTGAFSSNGGRDFAVVLRALADIGAMDITWRVLDSQWFGVAQRRRRVFLVADFGGHRAAEVLSIPASLSWHPPTREGSGEGSTTAADDRADGDSEQSGVIGALTASDRKGAGNQYVNEGKFVVGAASTLTARMTRNSVDDAVGGLLQPVPHTDVLPAMLSAASPDGPGRGARSGDTKDQYVVPLAFDWRASSQRSMNPGPVAPALEAQDKTAVALAFGPDRQGDVAHALRSKASRADKPSSTTYITTPDRPGKIYQGDRLIGPTDTWPTLPAQGGNNGGGPGALYADPHRLAVRRLTPRECERLQGFPDDHTRRGADGGVIADTHRYRVLGNAVTVQVAQHIAERLHR